jgi:hypothetical protein
MQRYERELEALLHSLGCEAPPDLQSREGAPTPGKKVVENPLRPNKLRMLRLARPTVERSIQSVCFLLALAFLLVPALPLLSAGLIVLSIFLLVSVLKRSRFVEEVQDDLASKDLSWKDVTVKTPRSRG